MHALALVEWVDELSRGRDILLLTDDVVLVMVVWKRQSLEKLIEKS